VLLWGYGLPFLGPVFGVFSQKSRSPIIFAASHDFDVTERVGVGLAGQHLCQTNTAIRCGIYQSSGSLEADMEPAAAIPKVVDGMPAEGE